MINTLPKPRPLLYPLEPLASRPHKRPSCPTVCTGALLSSLILLSYSSSARLLSSCSSAIVCRELAYCGDSATIVDTRSSTLPSESSISDKDVLHKQLTLIGERWSGLGVDDERLRAGGHMAEYGGNVDSAARQQHCAGRA